MNNSAMALPGSGGFLIRLFQRCASRVSNSDTTTSVVTFDGH